MKNNHHDDNLRSAVKRARSESSHPTARAVSSAGLIESVGLREEAGDQTGRTSVTSGTKCLSRFSIPCFSVAVEEGQPEQAPRM